MQTYGMPPSTSPAARLRRSLVHVSRRTGLLPLIGRLGYVAAVARTRRTNAAVQAAHPDEAFPPLHLAYDAFRTTDYQLYLEMGERLAGAIREQYRRVSATRVLEWGCGPLRILRHLAKTATADGVELHGTDYNHETIAWARGALPGVTFHTNELAPPLPLPPASFDFIYGISIFTHLSAEMQRAWLAELVRVLRPGGHLMLTTHSDGLRDYLHPEERARFDATGVVERSQVKEGSLLYVTYNSRAQMHALFGDLTVVVDDGRHPLFGGQHVWVVRKPA
jgi:SAM-dependent methyltransferase